MPIPEHTSEQNFANFAAIRSYLAGAGDDIKIDNFPRSVAEAEASPEWAEWKKAMDEEMGVITEMGTYTKEDLPAGRDTIGCKWVFLKKYDEDGNISRYKARLLYDLNLFAPL